MRRYLLIYLMLAITGCAGNRDETDINFGGILRNYQNWEKPVKNIITGTLPAHGPTVRIIYANAIAFDVIKMYRENKIVRVVMKDGAVIIKEMYLNEQAIGKEEPMLTIMVKDSMNIKAIDGWLYFVKKPGEAISLITGRMCVGCHESANEKHIFFDGNNDDIFRDYIFTPFSAPR